MLHFSTIAMPLMELVKKHDGFHWGERQQKAFYQLKEKLTMTLVLALPNFEQVFKIDCDASDISIRGVLS